MSEETRKRGDAIATADDRRHTETILATGEAPAASPGCEWGRVLADVDIAAAALRRVAAVVAVS